jgi:hypothetical protein
MSYARIMEPATNNPTLGTRRQLLLALQTVWAILLGKNSLQSTVLWSLPRSELGEGMENESRA